MSTLTKEQWKDLEMRLCHPFSSEELLVDGYKLGLQLAKAKGLRYEIIWYVDGHFKGIWLTQDCEERRRFARPVSHSLYKPSEKTKLQKTLGVRGVKKYFPKIDEVRIYHVWGWPSFKPLMRHLLANNKNIELLQ